MTDTPNPLKTRTTLINRLGANNASERDWFDFYNQYEKPVIGFIMARTPNQEIARDTYQKVMIDFSKHFKNKGFTYDPAKKFRGYMFQRVRWTYKNILQKRRQLAEFSLGEPIAGEDGQTLGDILQAVEDSSLEDQDELEFRRRVLESALQEEFDRNKKLAHRQSV